MIWIASFPKSQTVGFGKRCYSDNFFAKILTVTSGFQWTSCTEPPHVCFSCFLCLKTRFYLLKLFLRMLKCCFCCEYPETLTSSYCSSASRCSVFGWAVPLKSHKKDVATSKQLSPLSRAQTLESLFECVELAVSSMSNKSGKLQIINEVLEIKKKRTPRSFFDDLRSCFLSGRRTDTQVTWTLQESGRLQAVIALKWIHSVRQQLCSP